MRQDIVVVRVRSPGDVGRQTEPVLRIRIDLGRVGAQGSLHLLPMVADEDLGGEAIIHRRSSLPTLDVVRRRQAKPDESLVLGHEPGAGPHHIVELLGCPRHAQFGMKRGVAGGLVGWHRGVVHPEMIGMLIAPLVVGVGHDDVRPLLPDEADERPDRLLEGAAAKVPGSPLAGMFESR